MDIYSPLGSRIVSVVETAPARVFIHSGIKTFQRADDGEVEFVYDQTHQAKDPLSVDWLNQKSFKNEDNEFVFVAEDGSQWPESQLHRRQPSGELIPLEDKKPAEGCDET